MKNFTLKIALFFLSFALSFNAATSNNEPPRHGIGFGGSVFDTQGFIYRYNTNNIGLSSSFITIITKYQQRISGSLGASYSLNQLHFPKSKLPNSSLNIYLIGYIAPVYSDTSYTIPSKKSILFGLGIGPGIEYKFMPSIGVFFEVPWMTFIRHTIINGQITLDHSYPHMGGGLVYYI